jgi:hypothetical protein
MQDGRTAFVKAAVDDRTAKWLRAEQRIYASVRESILPSMLGWYDGPGCTLMLLEDLSPFVWPPPWTRDRIDAVLRLLERMANVYPPQFLPKLEDSREAIDGWSRVAEDPEPFLGLGLCNSAWLGRCLPVLREASLNAPLAGANLVHRDIRSDNICIRDGEAILVDWNWAVCGNHLMDCVGWLPSLHAEGGPSPEELAPEGSAELAALIAGYFAANAGLPRIPHAPRVREVQLQQLATALPWAIRSLGLPPP